MELDSSSMPCGWETSEQGHRGGKAARSFALRCHTVGFIRQSFNLPQG